MGASSVTGVGHGSADKAGQKGSEHLFVGVEKLIGTRIVLSGYVTMGGATQVVDLPINLPGNWTNNFDPTSGQSGTTLGTVSDYIIHVNAFNSATATYVSAITTTSEVQNFTITGQSGKVVFWSIVRVTNASVTTYPSIPGQ